MFYLIIQIYLRSKSLVLVLDSEQNKLNTIH